ncbi:acid protease [Laetiporus sulphureus 93-53]|uniref:Acid protease n=1 Tax=Laetiporus sulphureus 93-53 TaxID=1314785 RepID=A0A165EC73_9APHY|nr:acid protease [Laetiporus sulphureus 93-53]KZT06710.1 acid protease [Laetiporus sulphureus 93-53]
MPSFISARSYVFSLLQVLLIVIPFAVGIDLPLYRTVTRRLDKRDNGSTAIGLGDVLDVTYNVVMSVGSTVTTLVVDTGSSDLWLVSDAYTGNGSEAEIPLYSHTAFQPTGLDAELFYGDSRTGTYASGPIGGDMAGIAGLSTNNQSFAAINRTNTTVFQTGSAGILGLGFPPISMIWRQLLQAALADEGSPLSKRELSPNISSNVDTGTIGHPPFPSFEFLTPAITKRRKRLSDPSHTDFAIASFAMFGPLLARLVLQQALDQPLITTTLQRDTVQLGGNAGVLSLGGLPAGVREEQLVWVPVRAYTADQGGLPPPTDAPNEVYPLVWEVPVDDVYFDDVKLPQSALASPAISLSALIDTGNSLIRGPRDILSHIVARTGSTFDCSVAHNLSFLIGGMLFPVDPRDFARPISSESGDDAVAKCSPALAATDPPGVGGFLYSWSLGDPFLKSAMVAYYYGNLTHPSQDPPRVGLLSTVPANVTQDLQDAVEAAISNGGFPATSNAAPSGTLAPTLSGLDIIPPPTHSSNVSVFWTSGAATCTNNVALWIPLLVGMVSGLVLLGSLQI